MAKERGVSPEDAAIDLVIEDGSRVDTVYFLMSEENVGAPDGAALDELRLRRRGLGARGPVPELVAPTRAPTAISPGSWASTCATRSARRLPDAIRRLSHLPATNLGLKDRGLLKKGYFADVVVFDPAKVKDHATFEKPMQFSVGVNWVLVNGGVALANGSPTAQPTGRVVRGRGWKGQAGGGCKGSGEGVEVGVVIRRSRSPASRPQET